MLTLHSFQAETWNTTTSISLRYSYLYILVHNVLSNWRLLSCKKGFKVWKYLFQENPFGFVLLKEFPKLITTEFPGVPSDLNAAFEWNLNGKMYFFKGKQHILIYVWQNSNCLSFIADNQYYRFSDAISKVSPTYPRPITKWNLEIDKVDTAFNYPSKTFSDLYFISDGQVYKYDSTRDTVSY